MKQSVNKLLVAALVLAVAAGCAPVGPNYSRPRITNLPPNWKADPGWAKAEPADFFPRQDWWTIFGDQQLNILEQRCLADNQNLQVAVARVEQARAQVASREAALSPRVEFDPSATRSRNSANRPQTNPGAVNGSVVQNDFRPVIAASYEIDVFGRVRRDIENARATAEQTEADRENVRLILTAQVASAYFQMRQLDEEIAIVSQAVEAQSRALEAINRRYSSGASGQSDLLQQTALVQTSKAQLNLLKTQRNIQEDSLATLTGTPATGFALPPGRLPAEVPQVPVLLPGELLQRRPDVASAERGMAAANAQIGVAKAAYYPVFNLASTLFGTEANVLSKLASASSVLWSFGLAAAQMIFDGGRADAGVNSAEAAYRGTVAQYRQSVLVAVQESQDALGNLALLDAAIREQTEAVNNQNKAYDVSWTRYRGGLDNIISLALVQQNQLAAQRVQSQIRGTQFLTTVSLIKALGGGWVAPQAKGTADKGDDKAADSKPASKG